MSAVAALTALSLKLNFRNRMAILYGYLFPLIFLIAFWALSSSGISTNANPRDLLVNLSIITLAEVTWPNLPNILFKSSSVV